MIQNWTMVIRRYLFRKNKRIFFTEASDRETKSWLTIAHKETIHKTYRNDLCVFATRNYLEGYKINKSLSSLLVYRRIVLSAEKLSSKFHKYLEALLLGQLLIFWTILQPWVSPSDIPAAKRALFTNYIVDHKANWFRYQGQCVAFKYH